MQSNLTSLTVAETATWLIIVLDNTTTAKRVENYIPRFASRPGQELLCGQARLSPHWSRNTQIIACDVESFHIFTLRRHRSFRNRTSPIDSFRIDFLARGRKRKVKFINARSIGSMPTFC